MTKQTHRNRAFGMALIAGLLALAPAPVLAQSSEQEIKALWAEVHQLTQALQAVRKDLAAIRNSPAPGAPAPFDSAVVPLSGGAALGSQDAKVTVVEFVDYQCPYCQRNFQDTLPRILKEYVETGKVRYVALDFPLVTIHANALNAAVAARCSGEQGKYWEMHDTLFSNQNALDAERLPVYAKQLGLDGATFQTCLNNVATADRVRADMDTGQRIGITGTPAVLLGLSDPNDPSLVNTTRKIVGAQPYTAFKAAIDSLLDRQAQAAVLQRAPQQ
jgi:protein-disulfide isomerase